MKKLVAIASAVAAAIALVAYLGGAFDTTVAPTGVPEQTPMHAESPGLQPQPSSASTRMDSTPTQAAPVATPTRTEPAKPATQPTAANGARPPQRVSLLTPEEQRQLDACSAAWQRKDKHEQEVRNAEAKDPAWAYRMEEELREFTSQRLRSVSVEVTAIDCKTTYCDLNAQSFTAEAAAEFNTVMNALGQEPRGDFQGVSWSISEEAGKTLHAVQIKRRQDPVTAYPSAQPDAQELACMKVSGLQSERERAARDAEARDTSWADPMEQLLRQHITTKLAKHALASLEISCKTTFCQIDAGGQGAQSRDAFQMLSNEIGAEPWANMWTGESGGTGYGEKWEAHLLLLRQD